MRNITSSALCETNRKKGFPQENIFFHSQFRLPKEFTSVYKKAITSDEKQQFFAVASAQGEDTIAAIAVQLIFQNLQKEIESSSNDSFDFQRFSENFIKKANQSVCNLILGKGGKSVRVSLSLIFLEDDILKVMTIGNTRALLVRKNIVVPLTEDQTLAHQAWQSGQITQIQEQDHPDRNILTQFIGKFQQDGEVIAETSLKMKIQDKDQLYLLGAGVSSTISDDSRNTILTSANRAEDGSERLFQACVQKTPECGITILALHVDMHANNDAPLVVPVFSDDQTDEPPIFQPDVVSQPKPVSQPVLQTTTPVQSYSSKTESVDGDHVLQELEGVSERRKRRTRKILFMLLRYIGVFLLSIGVCYAVASILSDRNNIRIKEDPEDDVVMVVEGTDPEEIPEISESPKYEIWYITTDNIPLYIEPSETLDSEILEYLARGESVLLHSEGPSYSHVETMDGIEGYVIKQMLSREDPTMHEPQETILHEVTPAPTTRNTSGVDSNSEVNRPTQPASTTTTRATTTTTTAPGGTTTTVPGGTTTTVPGGTTTTAPGGTTTTAPGGTPTTTPPEGTPTTTPPGGTTTPAATPPTDGTLPG